MQAKRRIVFGPVPSRRLGASLGVDLLPFKTCSMDCVYCECGATTRLSLERAEYVPTEEAIKEIDSALDGGAKVDYVTFSGAGEPTLHSGIGRIVSHIKTEHPDCKVCLLTNASLLHDARLREELAGLDLIVPSLDASNEDEFQKINRPAPGLTLEAIVAGIAKFKEESKAELWLEIFIVPGVNDSLESALRFKALIERARPDKVQLNSLDRPGTESWVGVPDRERLKALAETLAEAGFPVECVGKAAQSMLQSAVLSTSEFNSRIMELLKRRPCTAEDLSSSLGMEKGKLEPHLRRMAKAGLIATEEGLRGLFYRPS